MLAFVMRFNFAVAWSFFELRFRCLVISVELSGVGQNFKKPQSRREGERDSSGIRVNRVELYIGGYNCCYHRMLFSERMHLFCESEVIWQFPL